MSFVSWDKVSVNFLSAFNFSKCCCCFWILWHSLSFLLHLKKIMVVSQSKEKITSKICFTEPANLKKNNPSKLLENTFCINFRLQLFVPIKALNLNLRPPSNSIRLCFSIQNVSMHTMFYLGGKTLCTNHLQIIAFTPTTKVSPIPTLPHWWQLR